MFIELLAKSLSNNFSLPGLTLAYDGDAFTTKTPIIRTYGLAKAMTIDLAEQHGHSPEKIHFKVIRAEALRKNT